ncbi:universal stress protein [Sedimenticola selenatireducens]|uniref:Universal stress protein n=1 Tax=Sedimenticola selenatireducens TaxID=191960 RepID=A0A558DM42_9GAMM|nr:universal stress protein [Sedimenticola selenatireducens]TVO78720.1 universal stress protein [Sedimenticola selenatireducens]TVT62082.1 MAG: universal stress protein [Sedimenticola selenatireducens]
MALKDILVHIDDTPYCERRFKIALQIAKQNEAGITALFARADPSLKGFEPNMKKRHEAHEALSEKIHSRFAKLADKAGITLTWVTAKLPSSSDQVTNQVIQQTQQSDMIIVGQHDNKSADGSVPEDMPEHLVLETGRPVLIIPYAGEFKSVGKKVVVAWTSGRESVRALNDAIPLMGEAKKVKVVAINPKKNTKKESGVTAEQAAAHLTRHGIKTESDQFSTRGVDEGNLILNCLADERADLLVMGAYGHHRFRELILGGVTQKVFENMTTPVLMSH